MQNEANCQISSEGGTERYITKANATRDLQNEPTNARKCAILSGFAPRGSNVQNEAKHVLNDFYALRSVYFVPIDSLVALPISMSPRCFERRNDKCKTKPKWPSFTWVKIVW